MPRVNVTLTAEELAYVDKTRGRHSRSSRVAEIVAETMGPVPDGRWEQDGPGVWTWLPDTARGDEPVTSTRRDGTDVIDTGGERYAVEFADGDAVLDGVRLPSRSRRG